MRPECAHPYRSFFFHYFISICEAETNRDTAGIGDYFPGCMYDRAGTAQLQKTKQNNTSN